MFIEDTNYPNHQYNLRKVPDAKEPGNCIWPTCDEKPPFWWSGSTQPFHKQIVSSNDYNFTCITQPRQTPDVMEQLQIERPERYIPGEIRPLGGSCVSGINKSHGYIVPPSNLHPDQHVDSTRQSKTTFIDKLPVCTDTKKDTLKMRNSEICNNIYDRRCLPFCPKEDVRQLELKKTVLTQPIIEPPKQKHTFEYPSLQRTSKHVESNSYKSKNECIPTIVCDDVAPKHPASLVMSCGDMERISSPNTDPCGNRQDFNILNLDTCIKNPRSLRHECQLEHKMCSCMESATPECVCSDVGHMTTKKQSYPVSFSKECMCPKSDEINSMDPYIKVVNCPNLKDDKSDTCSLLNITQRNDSLRNYKKLSNNCSKNFKQNYTVNKTKYLQKSYNDESPPQLIDTTSCPQLLEGYFNLNGGKLEQDHNTKPMKIPSEGKVFHCKNCETRAVNEMCLCYYRHMATNKRDNSMIYYDDQYHDKEKTWTQNNIGSSSYGEKNNKFNVNLAQDHSYDPIISANYSKKQISSVNDTMKNKINKEATRSLKEANDVCSCLNNVKLHSEGYDMGYLNAFCESVENAKEIEKRGDFIMTQDCQEMFKTQSNCLGGGMNGFKENKGNQINLSPIHFPNDSSFTQSSDHIPSGENKIKINEMCPMICNVRPIKIISNQKMNLNHPPSTLKNNVISKNLKEQYDTHDVVSTTRDNTKFCTQTSPYCPDFGRCNSFNKNTSKYSTRPNKDGPFSYLYKRSIPCPYFSSCGVDCPKGRN